MDSEPEAQLRYWLVHKLVHKLLSDGDLRGFEIQQI